MTSREERARHRAMWLRSREEQLATHLYMALCVQHELAGFGRWSPEHSKAIQDQIASVARAAEVFDLYDALVRS